MDNLSGHTPTQLLKICNDISKRHEVLKKEIVDDLLNIELLETGINLKTEELQELEKNYVEIIEKLSQ